MEGLGFSISDLAKLMGTAEDEENSGYVKRCGGVPEDGGADTVIRCGRQLQQQQQQQRQRQKDEAHIWDADEVADGAELDDTDDPRPQPQYTINFRQTVTSEDVFLQLGNKTPTTASCELLVVRVRLPGETRQSTVLEVRPRHVDVRARCWRLSLFLPHPVTETDARANWDTDTETLELLLPISRQLDVLNF